MNSTREYILITSLTLFSQKSFKEVTMKDIVDQTGLSKGAFYHYFNSKEQVFAEVIQHFFVGMMSTDYSRLSQNSLKDFYQEILAGEQNSRQEFQNLLSGQKNTIFHNNYYYLLFDAMRMLPQFKEHHLQQQKAELIAWESIIDIALKNKEIKSTITSTQLAKLFINLSDGVNINLIIGDNINHQENELQELWDALYNSLSCK
jgi:AcrR family transcriptional regulator